MVYTLAFRLEYIPRNDMRQVGYSMGYYKRAFYDYFQCQRKCSTQRNQCNIRAEHDGKVPCNTVEYTIEYSDWLYFSMTRYKKWYLPIGRCWAILSVTVLPDCLIVSTISLWCIPSILMLFTATRRSPTCSWRQRSAGLPWMIRPVKKRRHVIRAWLEDTSDPRKTE